MTPSRTIAAIALAAVIGGSLALTGCGRGAAPRKAASGTIAPKPVAAVSSAATSATASDLPLAAVSAVPARLVFTGGDKSRKVALTFDLCEVPSKPSGYDRKLVDVLVAEHAPATFMMGGHWAETHLEDAKFLGNVAFFEIGSHGYAHRHPTKIPLDAFQREIERAQTAITGATGHTPALFRFPYGEHDTTTVAEVAREGLVPVQWSVETGDPDPKVSAAAILRVVKQKTRNGSIVIMHANGRGWHSAEALPHVIAWLRSQGYELVTVSDLLGRGANP